MSALLGVCLGTGLLLIWWAIFFPSETPQTPRRRPFKRLATMLERAGILKVSPLQLLACCFGVMIFTFLVIFALTRALPVACCFALFGAYSPVALVRFRVHRRQASLREVWPDVVDQLRSAIRAGLSLPEALAQLGDKGPEELRKVFSDFAADYRATGNLDLTLNRLKTRLADPVADRIVEALRLAREVGGNDLGRLLGTLGEYLRETNRTRRELQARQSWTVNAARLAITAPWIVLLALSTQPIAIRAYNSAAGALILIGGLVVSLGCYRLMLRIGSLPEEERVLL